MGQLLVRAVNDVSVTVRAGPRGDDRRLRGVGVELEIAGSVGQRSLDAPAVDERVVGWRDAIRVLGYLEQGPAIGPGEIPAVTILY
jgi:hypothetical protein